MNHWKEIAGSFLLSLYSSTSKAKCDTCLVFRWPSGRPWPTVAQCLRVHFTRKTPSWRGELTSDFTSLLLVSLQIFPNVLLYRQGGKKRMKNQILNLADLATVRRVVQFIFAWICIERRKILNISICSYECKTIMRSDSCIFIIFSYSGKTCGFGRNVIKHLKIDFSD